MNEPHWFTKSKRAASELDDESWNRGGVSPTLNAMDNTGESRATVLTPVIGFNWANGGGYGNANPGLGITEDGTGPLSTSQVPAVAGVGVRRLTPLECERLQGFPDDWTAGQADSSRYRQMGNAVAVPVAEWIISRLVEVDAP